MQGMFNNTYISLKAGPNYYWNHNNGAAGLGFDINYGKWLINTTSLRMQLSGYYANNRTSKMYAYGHVDALFDVVSSIGGKKAFNSRSFLICGVGVLYNLDIDFDMGFNVGIGGDLCIGDRWRLTCELTTLIIPSDFDKVMESSILPALTMGVVRDINSNPMRMRNKWETQKLGDDWYVQIALGVSSLNYRGLGGMRERMSLLSPIIEFGVGKSITKAWSGRFLFSGFYCKSREELFSYYNVRGDMVFDIMGWLKPEERVSKIDIKPYAGVSLLARLDDKSNFLVGTALGSMVTFRPIRKNEIYMDFRYLMTPRRFPHVPEEQSTLSSGIATVTLGYTYYFTKRSFLNY